MLSKKIKNGLHVLGTRLELISSLLFMILVWSMDLDLEQLSNWPSFVTSSIEFIKKGSWWITIVIVFLALLGFFIRRHNDPWASTKLKLIVDEFQKAAFPTLQSERNNHHRVTLFKWKRCKQI